MKVSLELQVKSRKKKLEFSSRTVNAELMAHHTLAQSFLHPNSMDFAETAMMIPSPKASVLQLPGLEGGASRTTESEC